MKAICGERFSNYLLITQDSHGQMNWSQSDQAWSAGATEIMRQVLSTERVMQIMNMGK